MSSSFPHNEDAEKLVLGGILLDEKLIFEVLDKLSAEDFYVESHKPLYQAMSGLVEKGTPITPVTIISELKSLRLFRDTNAIKDISLIIQELRSGVPKSDNIQVYVDLIKEASLERQKIKLSAELQTALMSGNKLQALEVEDALQNLNLPSDNATLDLTSTFSTDVLKRVHSVGVSGKLITGVPTGILEFDLKTTGLQDGDLVIVAARPAMGKTAISINMGQFAAVQKGLKVVMFSLEMSKEQLYMRMLASQARIPLQKVRTGYLTHAEWARALYAKQQLDNATFLIDDSGEMNPLKMKTVLKRAISKFGNIDLVIVDYIQLMVSGKKSDNRQQEVTQISRALKLMAKEFKVPFIALSQLSRAPEQRASNKHKPQISDLRESGSIEQDADIVTFIYREEVYEKTTENEGLAEFIIAKHRQGPTDTINLYYHKDCTRFENLFSTP